MRLNGGEVKVSSGEMVSKSEKEVVKQLSPESSKTTNVRAEDSSDADTGIHPDVGSMTANIRANKSSEAGTTADAVAFEDNSSNPVTGTENAELERDDSTAKQ